MEITFNESVEDFELTFNFGKVIIPIRKIKLFLDKISEDEVDIFKCFDDCSAILIPTIPECSSHILSMEEKASINNFVNGLFRERRAGEQRMIEDGLFKSPQLPFSLKATKLLERELQRKYSDLDGFITIQQIDVISPREDYKCPSEFIIGNSEFTPPFVESLARVVAISNSNPHKANFFIIREQRHTFLLITIGNNIFMFDSVGQRYGKTKYTLGLPGNYDYLRLDEIPYTNMFLEYLRANPDKKLYFNLNGIQQDTTNCYTFAIDFLEGFCDKISSFSGDRVDALSEYLTRFFVVQLPENRQIFHEGSLDVLESAVSTLPENRENYPESSRRLILPPEILRSCQLTSAITEKAERVSNVQFTDIPLERGRTTLKDSLSRNLQTRQIRLRDGRITSKPLNVRIVELRKQQERQLLSLS